MKKKLEKLETYWVLYDVGNSAFTLLVSTIIPIYFKNTAQKFTAILQTFYKESDLDFT